MSNRDQEGRPGESGPGTPAPSPSPAEQPGNAGEDSPQQETPQPGAEPSGTEQE